MITLLEFLLKKHIDIDPEAVDLGLPSGTLWCSHNVGANKPEEYGDYFAWGEIKPKKEYSLDNYKFGTRNNITKYNKKDHKTKLDLEDDAAHVNMGEDWYIPTLDLVQELIDETTNEWISLNGIKGRLFTSSNGNSIFIPASGYFIDDKYYDVRNYCYLWTSTLNSLYHWNGYYLNSNTYRIFFDECNRWYGFSVRGVIDTK